MIETGKITNFILELRENIGGILAMVMGVLVTLASLWLTFVVLPRTSVEPPVVRTPYPVTGSATPTIVSLTPSAVPSPTPTSTTIPSTTSKIERIRDRGYLIAAVKYDFPPFGKLTEDGKVVGFDVDLVQAIADEWGVEVEFVQVTSANRIAKLPAGEVDIVAASMTHTKERDEIIDFSQTYFLDGQSLLVRKDSGIEGIQDLDRKTVAAIQGSTSINQIQAHADLYDVNIELLPFQEYPPALEALKVSQVDALTTNSVALSQFAKDNPELVLVGGLFSQEPYGMGLPAGDSYFNNLVNFTLQNLKEDGTYDELYKKWFGEESKPYPVEILPGEWPHTFADSPTILDKPVQSKVDEKLLSEECGFVAGVKYDFPPFGIFDESGEVKGFDVDIVKEFAKRWCGDENAVELVQVSSSDRIPKLASGGVDLVAASMTQKKERYETINFSQTYFADRQSVLVRKDSGITTMVDLNRKTVSAIQGSTSIENIQKEANKLKIVIQIVPFLEYPPAIQALKAGQVDALTTDRVALLQFARDNPELDVLEGGFTREPYGLGIPLHDDRFRDLVNFTLQDMKTDGTYDRLYKKWFGDDELAYPIEIWPGKSDLSVNTAAMVRIPAGEFIRGSNDGFSNEAPQQSIELNEFYIDQYEVTNLLYAQCVRAGKCEPPKIEGSPSSADDYSSLPVVWVTWNDATSYCEFVGKRLPTEAEWEKAARGTNGLIYPWGDDEPTPNLANFNNLSKSTLPVDFFPEGVSHYDVYNMAGNVREWVADWYQRDYYKNAPSQNPLGPSSGVTKVVRGGAWNDKGFELPTTRRKDFLPDVSDGALGFRCASSGSRPN